MLQCVSFRRYGRRTRRQLLQCAAVCCRVLHCIAVLYSLLQFVIFRRYRKRCARQLCLVDRDGSAGKRGERGVGGKREKRDRQTDRETDRQTYRQIDRQRKIDREELGREGAHIVLFHFSPNLTIFRMNQT